MKIEIGMENKIVWMGEKHIFVLNKNFQILEYIGIERTNGCDGRLIVHVKL